MDKKIVGNGIDLCEIKKMKSLFSRFKEEDLELIFTEKEIESININNINLYIIFSMKETLVKALGVGFNSRLAEFKNIEIILEDSDVKQISFNSFFEKLVQQKNICQLLTSLIVTPILVITTALFIGNEGA